MKKTAVILMFIALTFCATMGVSADSNTEAIYQIDDVTVVFDVNSQLSSEQQELIANLLVHPEYGVEQANLICDIFGHKNTSETVITITHKVFEESPRCFQENFAVTTCSRCNASSVVRTSYAYISCCPED